MNRTHGLRNTPEYNIWRGMKKRCQNHPRYAGRGITVCARWMASVVAFLADVGPRPSPEYSLDRWPNPDGNYEPGNVRWATDEEQSRNRGDFNRYLEFNGERKTCGEWCEVRGIPQDTLWWRLDAGWSVERALTEPVKLGSRPNRGTYK